MVLVVVEGKHTVFDSGNKDTGNIFTVNLFDSTLGLQINQHCKKKVNLKTKKNLKNCDKKIWKKPSLVSNRLSVGNPKAPFRCIDCPLTLCIPEAVYITVYFLTPTLNIKKNRDQHHLFYVILCCSSIN